MNLAVALSDAGVLDRYNVRLLGTPLETIRKAEDREFSATSCTTSANRNRPTAP